MAEKRFALIIASWDYTADLGLRKLIAPPQDAAALARVLQAPEIGGFEVRTLLNETSPKVAEEIEAFFTERQHDDLALLYFSGHGIKDVNGQLYFAMPNTRLDRLRATAIKAYDVNEMIRESKAQQKVLLLDCCYSGAFARGMTVKADPSIGTREYFEGRGLAILTASDALQYSFEEERVEGQGVQSVFTRILAQGLDKGEADTNGDGLITFDELYDYILDRIEQEAPKQKPRKWALDVQGKIVIARNPHPVLKPAQLPHELQQTIEDSRPWVREGAVRELGRLLEGSHPGLALAAQEALKRLAEDDSRRVASSAAEIMAGYTQGQRARGEAEREERERLAREQAEAERAAHEHSVQEQLAQERAEAERLAAQKAEAERIAREQTEQEWFARRNEGFEPIPFDSPTADREYGYALAPTGRVILGRERIPFALLEHHSGNGHRIIEVCPPIAGTNDAKDIRPAEVRNVEAIYVLLSAGDTRRTRGGQRFEGKEIGRLVVSFYDESQPQVVPLRLGVEIREWVSGETRYDVVAKASEAEEVWQSPDRRHTIDMICVKIEKGPRDILNLVIVGECPWLPGGYKELLPSVRISGVTYKTIDRAMAERIKQEKAGAERLAALKAEGERIAREKAEAERLAALKVEEDRIARERAEQERIKRERAEAERKAREGAEQYGALKAAEQRLAREKAEVERIATLKAVGDRIARDKAEQERLVRKKVEDERAAREETEQERLTREKAETELLATQKAEQGDVNIGGDIVGRDKITTTTATTTSTTTAIEGGPVARYAVIGVIIISALAIIVLAVLALRGITPPTPSPTRNATAISATETLQSSKPILPTETLSRTPEPIPTTAKPPSQTPVATTPPPAPIPTLGIGSTQVSDKDGMVQVYIPAGEFLMGSADSDSQASGDEKPLHTVYLDAFWIDKTEVTNVMYALCVKAGACQPPGITLSYAGDNYYDNSQYADYPVIYVSWNNAQAYCQWAERRLPTEAEWEKAARGTDGRKYPWGNQDVAGNLLNFADRNVGFDWADKSVDDGYKNTAPVGSYPSGASPYGALDMAGNVWEWVNDWYNATYYSSSPLENPPGPSSGQGRVLRGGSWYDRAQEALAALRIWDFPRRRFYFIGFRCARSP